MDKLAKYEKILEELKAEKKFNFGFPFTSVNGNMYSFLSKSDVLGIRLPQESREEFLTTYNSEIYQTETGRVIKEYVVVPDALLEQHDEVLRWFQASLTYAESLKPKKKK